jgi:hypothetical protein
MTFFTREWELVKTNYLMVAIVSVLLLLLVLAMSVPALRAVFRFTQISSSIYLWLIFAPLLVISLTGWIVKRKIV